MVSKEYYEQVANVFNELFEAFNTMKPLGENFEMHGFYNDPSTNETKTFHYPSTPKETKEEQLDFMMAGNYVKPHKTFEDLKKEISSLMANKKYEKYKDDNSEGLKMVIPNEYTIEQINSLKDWLSNYDWKAVKYAFKDDNILLKIAHTMFES